MALQQIETAFGQALAKKMNEMDLSIRDLAAKAETTYEYIRKLRNGTALPSRLMLKHLCTLLKLNMLDVEKLVVADRIRMKYGRIPALLSDKNPELEPLETLWPHLSEEHKQDLLAMARTFAKRDRNTPTDS
jgi:transcriptional regulator with XRE-family HTH domain